MFIRVRHWLRAILRGSALEREMRDEMQFHLDRQTELLVARGMSRVDAQRAARREFGNVGVHQDEARDARPARWVDSVGADARFAFRFFARKPLSAATIVLALAFGIGGYAALFGFVQSAIMRPLSPAVPPDVPLVLVNGTVREKAQPVSIPMRFSYTALREMSALRTIFSAVTGWTESDVVVDVPGALDRAATHAEFVADGYFPVMGLRPAHGSGFPAIDPSAPAESHLMAVISDAMWEDAFGRKDVSNRTMMVNGVAVHIIGVAPPRFDGLLSRGRRLMVWLPLAARATILASTGGANGSTGTALSSADSTLFEVVGRLQPGISPEQATAAARVVAAQARSQMTPSVVGPGVRPPVLMYDVDVVLLRRWSGAARAALGMPRESSQLGPLLGVFGTVATLLLLVVCTNVAALVVSASVGRRQEIAVRLSLGASRARVIRQLLTESVILAMMGGSLGLVVYWLVTVAISRIPIAEFFRPDLGTVAFTMSVALGTGILCGLAPALHATRDGIATALKDSTTSATRRSRLQRTFVVAQVMFTQPLLLLVASAIGGLVMETKQPLRSGTPERVLQLRVDVATIPGSRGQQRTSLDRLMRRIAEEPGVVTALPRPVRLGTATLAVRADDRRPDAAAIDQTTVEMDAVMPAYFDVIGVPLLRGDAVAPSASDTSATVIIGSDLARKLWGDADPIGRHFTQVSAAQRVGRDIIVSGVYDSRYLDKTGRATVFRAVKEFGSDTYLIRTAIPASDLVVSIRRLVREELPSTPIAQLATLADVDAETSRERQSIQAGAAACGALVLLLSSIGLYGAVAVGVVQRRREIGVRMALGARTGQVVRLFHAGGVRLGVIGLLLGLPVSLVANHWLNSHGSNPDTTPNVLLVGGIVAIVVLAVGSVATLIPATRAARVNPVITLRSE